jgi:prolipoprotein diacylglyceryl transferase
VTTTVLAYIPSPPQGVWDLGPLPIRAYALFIIIGIVAALVIGDRRWAARGGERGVIYDIALWAVPFGLIGGRLYHVITDWQTYFGDGGAGLGAALRIWEGGLGIWGAVALGGVGAWIGCRRHGIPLPAFGDAIAPGIVLAQAIGRLGNYFNQELYGRPTTLPWGLEIYERRDASGALDSLNGVSTGQLVEVVHPTFLYELLWNILIFAVLIWVDRRFKIGHGRLFALYVAGYCLGRFWIELMRSDVATHIAGIRINSFTSTFVFIGAVVYIMVAPRGREHPSTLKGKPTRAPERTPRTPEEEDTIEEFVKELTAVAATTGVVAAAKTAGEAEDEDASAVGDEPGLDKGEKAEEPTTAEAEIQDAEAEAAEEAEAAAGDGVEEPSEPVAEEFAAGEEAEAKEAAEVAEHEAAETEEAEAAVEAAAAAEPSEAHAEIEAEKIVEEAEAEAPVEVDLEAEAATEADESEPEQPEPAAAGIATSVDQPQQSGSRLRQWWRRRRS